MILIQKIPMFKGKNVLLGVTGSIAAYKSSLIVRLFIKLGASVQVIQTESSLDFVTPLTLSTLSKRKVLVNTIDTETNSWNNHVELALWADIFLIAPVTAKTMSKMAEGNCDNLLLSTYLSSKCTVYFAPSMDLDMYKHKSTQVNINKLESFGNKCISAKHGELASGLIGEGRMAEPQEILDFIIDDINKTKKLYNKECLVTAGPTYEFIDPVRYISNESSGKMGIAIAEELAQNGAIVNLIIGPSNLSTTHPNINVTSVVSALEMYNKVKHIFLDMEIAIFSAAVADYRPKNIFIEKIKKEKDALTIDMIKNKDILLEMSSIKKKGQFIVGFALETENEIKNATRKLQKKNLDMIIMNSIRDLGSGFNTDTNKISIIDKSLNVQAFQVKQKSEVAKDIIHEITQKINL